MSDLLLVAVIAGAVAVGTCLAVDYIQDNNASWELYKVNNSCKVTSTSETSPQPITTWTAKGPVYGVLPGSTKTCWTCSNEQVHCR